MILLFGPGNRAMNGAGQKGVELENRSFSRSSMRFHIIPIPGRNTVYQPVIKEKLLELNNELKVGKGWRALTDSLVRSLASPLFRPRDVEIF